jgi:multidrug efflux pump subunit AcrA (membrane-fusion protein)
MPINKQDEYGDHEEQPEYGEEHDASPTHAQYVEQRLHPRRDLPHEPSEAQTRYEEERHEARLADRNERQRQDVPIKNKKSGRKVNKGALIFWVVVALVVLLLIFLVGFIPRHRQDEKNDKAAKSRATAAPTVEVVQVKRSQSAGELTVPGTTSPVTQAYIYARANGYLKRRYVDIGDHVRQGQLLAIIDSPDLDQQVDQARAQVSQAEAQLTQQQSQLDLAQVTWDRYRVLAAKGVFARQDADQQETNYKSYLANVGASQRNVDAFRANLRHAIVLQSYERVTAPFDGVITARNVDVGALINTGGSGLGISTSDAGGTAQTAATNNGGTSGSSSTSASPSTAQAQGGLLFAMAQLDRLRILISVPEGYANGVHRGQKAQVRVQEFAGKDFSGTVTRTSNSIDQNTRTLLTEVDVDNKQGQLIPGMYAVVSFVQIPGEPPLIVPGDAIAVRQDKTVVAVVKDNKIHLQTVEIGRDYGPSVEIVGGVKEGEMIASDITDDVKDGAQVQAKIAKEPGQNNGSGRAQSNQSPGGSAQYGDEFIVNQSTDNTSQNGKGKQGGGSDSQKKGSGGSEKKQ